MIDFWEATMKFDAMKNVASKTLLAVLALGALLQLQGCAGVVVGGVAAGAMMVTDRRSAGTILDDESIENATLVEAKRQFTDGTHINITSYNRTALITGEVFNETQKTGIEDIVRRNRLVKGVHNELGILPVASIGSVSADSAMTARVKARLIDAKDVSATSVKVVTERRIVYLMGIVSKAEGQIASEVARTTSGVQRVVRLFEYTD
jgi:osmotically-inducible protein OsmY